MKSICLFCLVLCLLPLLGNALFAQEDDSPKEALETVLELYDQYDVVMLSESHRNKEVHDFIREFVLYPKTARVIDDIVVEFGNALYQDIADRYVMGEPVSDDSVALIWRNHTVLFTWDSPVYKRFFQTVREANLRRKKGKKLRVLLGDPPINWANINTPAEYESFVKDRGIYAYQVLKNEVLPKGRKALVIIGGGHVVPVDLRTGEPVANLQKASLGQLLKSNYPGRVFGLWNMSGTNEDWGAMGFDKIYEFKLATDPLVRGRSFQSLYETELFVATEIDGTRTWAPLAADNWVRIEQAVDGVLYLGPENITVTVEEGTYTDVYLEELARRCPIVDRFFGFEFFQNQLNRIRGN